MVADVMSMSTFGRITDPIKKMDELLGLFYASDYSQSNIFFGKIQSFPQIIQDIGKDTQILPSRVESAIRQLFLGYYDDVEVSASLAEIIGEGNSYKLNISINATVAGKAYSATRISEVRDSVLMRYPDGYVQ